MRQEQKLFALSYIVNLIRARNFIPKTSTFEKVHAFLLGNKINSSKSQNPAGVNQRISVPAAWRIEEINIRKLTRMMRPSWVFECTFEDHPLMYELVLFEFDLDSEIITNSAAGATDWILSVNGAHFVGRREHCRAHGIKWERAAGDSELRGAAPEQQLSGIAESSCSAQCSVFNV